MLFPDDDAIYAAPGEEFTTHAAYETHTLEDHINDLIQYIERSRVSQKYKRPLLDELKQRTLPFARDHCQSIIQNPHFREGLDEELIQSYTQLFQVIDCILENQTLKEMNLNKIEDKLKNILKDLKSQELFRFNTKHRYRYQKILALLLSIIFVTLS